MQYGDHLLYTRKHTHTQLKCQSHTALCACQGMHFISENKEMMLKKKGLDLPKFDFHCYSFLCLILEL